MKIINSLLLLDDALRPPALASWVLFSAFKELCTCSTRCLCLRSESPSKIFTKYFLVLFSKLTVIINSFAHKVARNNFDFAYVNIDFAYVQPGLPSC